MKYLTIVRHGKAEDPLLWADDFLRPLTERGRRDTRSAARILETLEPPVDWWVTSPAARALETAQALHAEIAGRHEGKGNAPSQPLQQEANVYMATAEALLAFVRQAPPSRQHMAMIGHNPGLEGLVAGLCAGGAALSFRLPTAAVAHLELEVAHWEQVRWGCGTLRLLVTPKATRR